MIEFFSAFVLLGVLILGVISFSSAINNTNVNADIEDSAVNTYEDIILFNDLKRVALARAAAEDIDCMGNKVVELKRCDNNIIDISKRIKRNTN